MAEIKVPIFNGMFEGESGVEVANMDTRIINGFVDKFKTIHKRPALSEVGLNAAAGTYGSKNLYAVFMTKNEASYSNSNKIIIVGADASFGYIYEGDVVNTDGLIELHIANEDSYSKASASTVLRQLPPKYVEGTNSSNAVCSFLNIFGVIYQYNYVLASAVTINPAEISGDIIDVAFINKRLIAVDTFTDNVYYSAIGDPTDFSVVGGGGSFAAESQADQVRRIMSVGNDLYLFAPNSVDLYYDTGNATIPFARYDGSEIKIGLISSDLLVRVKNTFYFHGSDGMIYMLKGRDIQVISDPINKYLSNIKGFNNSSAQHLSVSGQDFIVFSYEDAVSIDAPFVVDATPPGVSFVYHVQLQTWYIWTDTDPINAMTIKGASYSSLSSKTYVADYSKQTLQELRLDTGYSGNKEKMIITSGNISLDTHKRKSSHRITGRMKGAVGPTLKFREGPDSDVSWPTSTSIAITITDVNGELLKIMRLGQYRIRQYQVVHSDNTPFSIGDMTEEVEVLGS